MSEPRLVEGAWPRVRARTPSRWSEGGRGKGGKDVRGVVLTDQ